MAGAEKAPSGSEPAAPSIPNRAAWLLNRPEAALVNVASRIGQVLGPPILAWLWSARQYEGLALALSGLLFWLAVGLFEKTSGGSYHGSSGRTEP